MNKPQLLFFSAAVLLFLNACQMSENKKLCIPDPVQSTFVYDIADVLSETQENALNLKLSNFAVTSSNALVVITHPNFCGDEPWHYATLAGENMGVGTDSLDNGMVLVVGTDVRKTFIAVGDGLEGAIPDIYAKRIVEEQLLPAFRENNYPKGIEAATTRLMDLALGEYRYPTGTAQSKKSKNTKRKKTFPWGVLFVFGFMFVSGFGRFAYRAHRYSQINEMGYWAAVLLLLNQSGRHTGRYDDFNNGRGPFGGGFGGGGGGGFGGFGGGGFGGGGAGGSW